MFDNEVYLATYAQIIRDAVVAAVDWMPPTCEIPSGGGQSDFELVVQRHLKGADRQIASGFLLDVLAITETSSPYDWLDSVSGYINEPAKSAH